MSKQNKLERIRDTEIKTKRSPYTWMLRAHMKKIGIEIKFEIIKKKTDRTTFLYG